MVKMSERDCFFADTTGDGPFATACGPSSTGRPAFQPSSKAPGISTRYGIDDSGSAEPKN
jgi:hypothetical protein